MEWLILLILFIFLLNIVVLTLFLRAKRWHDSLEEQLLADSEIVETAQGPIEFILRPPNYQGNQTPVLILHGAPGGYDQAIVLGRLYFGTMRRKLCVSRPGYLQTPLSTGLSPAAQADALAALLEELEMQQTIVCAVAAGAPAALHFAARHPDRTKALILIAAITAPVALTIPRPGPATSSLGSWLQCRLARRYPQRMGKGSNRYAVQIVAALHLFETRFPFDRRIAGWRNDAKWLQAPLDVDYTKIQSPTLMIHGTEDEMAPFAEAQQVARQISNANLTALDGFAHLHSIVSIQTGDQIQTYLRETGL